MVKGKRQWDTFIIKNFMIYEANDEIYIKFLY